MAFRTCPPSLSAGPAPTLLLSCQRAPQRRLPQKHLYIPLQVLRVPKRHSRFNFIRGPRLEYYHESTLLGKILNSVAKKLNSLEYQVSVFVKVFRSVHCDHTVSHLRTSTLNRAVICSVERPPPSAKRHKRRLPRCRHPQKLPPGARPQTVNNSATPHALTQTW